MTFTILAAFVVLLMLVKLLLRASNDKKTQFGPSGNIYSRSTLSTTEEQQIKIEQDLNPQKMQLVPTDNGLLSGLVLFVTRVISPYRGAEYEMIIYPDMFIFLLSKDGKFHDVKDMLYHNSENRVPIEIRGGQGDTPISKDEAILGPMYSDDFGCAFRMNLGLDYSEDFECCLINLGLLDEQVDTILFVHYNYDFIDGEIPARLKVVLDRRDDIIEIKKKEREPFESVLKMGCCVDGEPRGIHRISNCYSIDLSEGAHYTSSMLKRYDNGGWAYISHIEYFDKTNDAISKYFEEIV